MRRLRPGCVCQYLHGCDSHVESKACAKFPETSFSPTRIAAGTRSARDPRHRHHARRAAKMPGAGLIDAHVASLCVLLVVSEHYAALARQPLERGKAVHEQIHHRVRFSIVRTVTQHGIVRAQLTLFFYSPLRGVGKQSFSPQLASSTASSQRM